MSPKSKRAHASKSKSKSQTVKKGGLWPFSSSSKEEPKFDGVAPNGETQTTNTGTSANNTSNSGYSNPISALTSWFSAKEESSSEIHNDPTMVKGGKRRSKKSRKSKKHRKTNKTK